MKERKVTRAQRRLCYSYVSSICDDDGLQRILPQYILTNERGVRKRDLPSIAAMLPAHIRVLRRKSAWTDAAFCNRLLQDLRHSLALQGCSSKVILFWDCARPHLVPSVLARARTLHIHPVIIPPGTTGILQPLDTHVFGPFKRKLEENVHAIDVRASGDTLSSTCFFKCLGNAIESAVSSGSWKGTFCANGLRGSQEALSKRVVEAFGDGLTLGESAKPSLDSLAWCFPKGYALTDRIAYGTASETVPRRRSNALIKLRWPREQLGRTRSETLRMRFARDSD